MSGVHGRVSGKLGRRDLNLVGLNKDQADKLINDNASEIDRLNVKIEVVDVGSFRDREVLDEEALIGGIKEKNPTVIILTFCHSNYSELKTILANAGVLSTLFLDTRRENMDWRISPFVEEQN